MADYREELLDVRAFPTEDVIRLQNAFHAEFPKADACMEYADGTLRFLLCQLDVIKYRDFIEALEIDGALKQAAFDIVNKIGSYGIRGSKRHFAGYNAERKVSNRKAKEQDRGKHYYANDNDFAKENNPLPAEFENKIVCADSLEYLKKLPDNCIDIIFTSPPIISDWNITRIMTQPVGTPIMICCSAFPGMHPSAEIRRAVCRQYPAALFGLYSRPSHYQQLFPGK